MFIAVSIFAIWLIILIPSNNKPALLPAIAGCYLGDSIVNGEAISINPSGTFIFGNLSTKVTVYEDKLGLSLLPREKVVVSERPYGRLVLESGYPLLIRISNSKHGFHVMSETGTGANFSKIPCADHH